MTTKQIDKQFHRVIHTHPRTKNGSVVKSRPFSAIFAGLALYVVIVVILYSLGSLAAGAAGVDTEEYLFSEDPTSLSSNIFFLGSLAIMMPIFFVTARIAGYEFRFLWSVVGRIRWDIIGIAAGVSLVVELLSQLIVNIGVAGLEFRHLETKHYLVILVVLALVPFQATAEELLARGFLPQILGKWVKSPWIAYAPGAVVWVLLHSYGSWGLIALGWSAILYAFLVHKTGGIETTIAIHTIGNYLAFLQPVLLVSEGSGDVSFESALLDMFLATVTVAVTYVLLRHRVGKNAKQAQ